MVPTLADNTFPKHISTVGGLVLGAIVDIGQLLTPSRGWSWLLSSEKGEVALRIVVQSLLPLVSCEAFFWHPVQGR